MIKVVETGDGILITVRARPGAKNTKVLGEYDGAVRVALAAQPEKGKANKELIKFLAAEFGIPQKDIEISGGEISRDKRVTIHASKVGDVLNKINEWNDIE